MRFTDNELVVFDLEYTDPSLAQAACTLPDIIEIGAVKIDRNLTVIDTFTSLVQPPNIDAVTDYCVDLTGISRGELEAAPNFGEVWKSFAKFTNFQNTRLSSWGTHWDVPVLRHAYFKRRLGYPHNIVPLDATSFVYAMSGVWGFRSKGWSLRAVCERLGIHRKNQHRALPDALAVVDVFRALQRMDEPDTDDSVQLIEL